MSKIQKGEKRGKLFSSDYQPKNRRKPRLFSVLKKEYGIDLSGADGAEISKDQIEDILQAVLVLDPRETLLLSTKLNHSVKALKKSLDGLSPEEMIQVKNRIAKGERLSQVFLTLNNAISGDNRSGRSDTLRWIIEYLFGRASQPIESEVSLETSNAPVDLSGLSDEELLQYNALMEKIEQGKKQE